MIENLFRELIAAIQQLTESINNMAIGQQQFDADLQALVAQIGTENATLANLVSAIQAFLANPQVVDLTTEDTSVNQAAAAVVTATQQAAAELAQIPPPPPPPGPGKPSTAKPK